MKKLMTFIILMILSVLLLGCQKETDVLTIMVPSGSPALAQLYLQQNVEQYRVDVVNGADALLYAFGSESHDVIFAPTNLGAKLYQSGMNYLFAGTVVWGNYYLIAKNQSTFDIASLEGKNVVVFGQNQTSDIILRYLLNELNVSVTITYVDSVATASAMFMADNDLIVMVAEPSLSAVSSKVSNVQIIDLQTTYQSVTGSDSYPQAGVFVNKSLDHKLINSFLLDLGDSVELVNQDPHAASLIAVELEYAFSQSVIASAIPFSHLEFVSANDSKVALEAYFNMIQDFNSALIGGSLPNDDFYYQP